MRENVQNLKQFKDTDWTHLALDGNLWWTAASAVMDLGVACNWGHLLAS
jgi:hypothetical protein